MVDEAVAMKPPLGSRVNTVVEEIFWTTKGFPLCPPVIRRVKRFAVVEVAPTVRTLLTSAEVVTIATLSVCVSSLTSVPSSVQPTLAAPPPSAPHWMFPEASVSNTKVPLQLRTVES
jgi:hypothetical protein